MDKVCEIVKKQLAVPEGTEVCGASKFSDLGADSLDTVNLHPQCLAGAMFSGCFESCMRLCRNFG